MGRLAKMAAAVGAVAVVLLGSAAVAVGGTAPPAGSLLIRSVDTRTYGADGKVSLVVEADLQSSVGGYVSINGVPAKNVSVATTAQALSSDPSKANKPAVPTGIVFVVDTSKAMNDHDAIAKVAEALSQLTQLRQPNQEWALISYGVQSRVVSAFTSDPAAFAAAAGRLTAATRDDSAPWDGLRTALDLFDKRPDLQRNIVFISTAADSVSSNTYLGTRGDVVNQGVEFSAINITRPLVDTAPLAALANDSHGRFISVTDPAGITGALNTSLLRISNQRLVVAQGPSGADALDITVTLGPRSAIAHVIPGSLVSGGTLNPQFTPARVNDSALLHNKNVKPIGALLALVAAVLLAVGLVPLLVRDGRGLEQVLSHYGEDRVALDVYDGDGSNPAMVQSKLVSRAVEFTSDMASRRGLLQWLERSLELADLPLRAGEALFVYLAASFLVAAVTLVLVGNLMITVMLAGAVIAIPPVALKTICARRRIKFISQLPDMLTLMASTLKAGYSLMQGVEAVSQEVSDPMGKELRRIVVEARLGRPLEEAMEDAAARMDSLDFSWAVMAISIQREVGGNLAELLMTVADTMTERERLRRDVKSLTAEGRMSAIVLGMLPPGLGVVMYGMNPAYMKILFTNPTGQKLLGLAVVMIVGGFIWMKKMVQVDV